MAKIYTKTGDNGTTGLIGGKRIPKDSARIEAYGSVDELNAAIGVVRSQGLRADLDRILERLQDDLFTIGADLALPAGTDRTKWSIPAITDDDIADLEKHIDQCQATLEPLREFVLPGGTAAAAMMHFARTIVRRAERRCVALAHAEAVDPNLIRYLNRLSDLCFVMARVINRDSSSPEAHPTFRK